MKITYHGHACFAVTSGNFTIVLDPFEGVDGFSDIRLDANMVLCSHNHHDHDYVAGVNIIPAENPFEIEYIDCFHDECGGAKRGPNKITILKAEGKRIAHMGDLGHMLEAGAIEKLKGVDVLMIPVGGFFTIDAKAALELISVIEPKQIAPMHYRDGDLNFEIIDGINVFLSQASGEVKSRIILLRGYGRSVEI